LNGSLVDVAKGFTINPDYAKALNKNARPNLSACIKILIETFPFYALKKSIEILPIIQDPELG